MMHFKFSNNLSYQLTAIDSIVNLFDTGKNTIHLNKDFDFQNPSRIISNTLEMDKERILQNLKSIQAQNNIDTSDNIEGEFTNDFSIEMETGTGKTYVYLRTILELNKKYNLKKFIILVPSVAIREGVLKTLEQTKEHFYNLYNTGFGYFAYDSDKLSKVREFIQSNDIQIMIMTIQSFNTDTKVLKQTPDRFHGERPIDLIAETNPVVIMDEPQNMESELAKEAIKELKPMFKLRYSATHREVHNLVYRLTPVDAYRQKLVKKISVYGIRENDAGAFVCKVKEIITKKGENPKAKVILEIKRADGTHTQDEVTVSSGDDLYRKSKKNEKYQDLVVQDINANYSRVELSNGEFFTVDQVDRNKEVIFRTQIRETIKAHFDKQREIGNRLKVLSLFFIDKVDNYIHDDSLLKNLFIEEFDKLKKNYDQFRDVEAHTVHKGYFASKKVKGIVEFKDSTSGSSKEDKEAYDLIMKNKEQLLSFSEPVSFIFSHSALKEGWDNPNIFQICTLRETNSIMKKRQEIGRGLRLPVDTEGNRIYDPEISILTVIANSSYEEYAGGLQQEFTDAGYVGAVGAENAREEKICVKTTEYLKHPDFIELWKRISKKTKFTLEVMTDILIEKAVRKIDELNIQSISVIVEKGEIFFNREGNLDNAQFASNGGYKINTNIHIPNIVERISKETELTRKTIFEIISKVSNLDLLFENPEEYIRSVILIIKTVLQDILLNDGLLYTPTKDVYDLDLTFHDFDALPSKTIESKRSVFDHIVCDGKSEKEFAEQLENSSRNKVYVKLPREFTIDTPVGKYNPDWGIVWKTIDGEKEYSVQETKFEYKDLDRDLTWEEKYKIECAKKHFKSIDVDFRVTTKFDEVEDLVEPSFYTQ